MGFLFKSGILKNEKGVFNVNGNKKGNKYRGEIGHKPELGRYRLVLQVCNIPITKLYIRLIPPKNLQHDFFFVKQIIKNFLN